MEEESVRNGFVHVVVPSEDSHIATMALMALATHSIPSTAISLDDYNERAKANLSSKLESLKIMKQEVFSFSQMPSDRPNNRKGRRGFRFKK